MLKIYYSDASGEALRRCRPSSRRAGASTHARWRGLSSFAIQRRLSRRALPGRPRCRVASHRPDFTAGGCRGGGHTRRCHGGSPTPSPAGTVTPSSTTTESGAAAHQSSLAQNRQARWPLRCARAPRLAASRRSRRIKLNNRHRGVVVNFVAGPACSLWRPHPQPPHEETQPGTHGPGLDKEHGDPGSNCEYREQTHERQPGVSVA